MSSDLTTIVPTFQDITPQLASQFQTGSWFATTAANNVPEHVAPAMLSQGYEVGLVNRVQVGGTFTNPVFGYTYGLTRTEMNGNAVLGSLLTQYVNTYNEGRDHNQRRYEDILALYKEMLAKSQTDMANANDDLQARLSIHRDTIAALEVDYEDFFTDVQTDLNNLTATLDADRTRVNDEFDTQVAAARQDLTTRGFYSSAMWDTIKAGIEERRATALTEVSEREQRLLSEITLRKNQIYVEVLRMRSGLIDQDLAITNRDQDFRTYELTTRNQIVSGLLTAVENREDAYPSLGEISQIAVALGETGRPQRFVN